MCHASECVRLAGLTDDLTVRDQLLDLAQDWLSAPQRERPRSDDARVVRLRDDVSQTRSENARIVPLRDDDSQS